jgi:hypothetical protein
MKEQNPLCESKKGSRRANLAGNFPPVSLKQGNVEGKMKIYFTKKGIFQTKMIKKLGKNKSVT